MTANHRQSNDRPVGQDVLRRARSALLTVKAGSNSFEMIKDLERFSDGGRHGAVGIAFLVLNSEVATRALETTRVMIGANDGGGLAPFENWGSATTSCGGMALFFLAAPATGGAAATLGVIQAMSCLKSVADLVYHMREGKALFRSPMMKSVELSIDAAEMFGSVASMGLRVGASWSVSSLSRALLRRGATPVSRWNQLAAGVDAAQVGLQGVDVVVEFARDDRVTAAPATPDRVHQALSHCGLGERGALWCSDLEVPRTTIEGHTQLPWTNEVTTWRD